MNSGTERDPLRSIPTKHVPEAKADIGTILKEARLKKGHSLEAVTQQTRIPKKFLTALEENRLEEFPALVYLRGFLKSYCDYLDVAFEPLWESVLPPKASSTAPAPTLADKAPAHTTAPALTAAPAPPHAGAAARRGLEPSEAWALGLAAALAAGVAFWLSRPAPGATEAQRAPSPPAALEPIHAPAEPALVIDFRDEVWVSLSVDGVPRFEGRAPRGKRQEWSAQRYFSLRTSDPQALRLTLNGAPFELPAPDATDTYRIETP